MSNKVLHTFAHTFRLRVERAPRSSSTHVPPSPIMAVPVGKLKRQASSMSLGDIPKTVMELSLLTATQEQKENAVRLLDVLAVQKPANPAALADAKAASGE